MHVAELIRRKRDGGELTEEELGFLVRGIADGTLSDAQVGALAMAILIQGLTAEELFGQRFEGSGTERAPDTPQDEAEGEGPVRGGDHPQGEAGGGEQRPHPEQQTPGDGVGPGAGRHLQHDAGDGPQGEQRGDLPDRQSGVAEQQRVHRVEQHEVVEERVAVQRGREPSDITGRDTGARAGERVMGPSRRSGSDVVGTASEAVLGRHGWWINVARSWHRC